MATLRREADRSLAFRRFLLENVRPTGRTLGKGICGSAEEVRENGLVCVGKSLRSDAFPGVGGKGRQQAVIRKYVDVAQLLSDLQHPNLVQFVGLCLLEDTPLPVIVTEWMDTNLSSFLESTPDIALGLKKSMLVDVANGLAYLHEHRPSPIVHMDLTATNVLLNSSSLVAKIGDVGNYRIVDLLGGQWTHFVACAHKNLVYMPPDVLEGRADHSPSFDVFSFGHLALFVLTQVFPCKLLSSTYLNPDNRSQLITRNEVKRRDGYFARLHQQLGERHPIVDLVKQCLDNDATQRPSTVELLQRLQAMEIENPYQRLTRVEMTQLLQQKIEPRNDAQVQRLQSQLQQLEEQLQQADQRARRAEEKLRAAKQPSTKTIKQHSWLIRKDDFELTDKELGRGAWGTVTVASYRGVKVAAKSLHSVLISEYNVQLFGREMTIAARVRHPNLVQFLGATGEGGPVILMELMSTTLRAVLDQRPFNPPQITGIARDVANALNYLHLMRPDPIIHRGVSSTDVLLNPGPNHVWTAKLGDFGSANFLAQVATPSPGNPVYAAPEAKYPSEQSPKMDVYSFGVLLLEVCTRAIPDPEERDILVLTVKHPQMAVLIPLCLQSRPRGRLTMNAIVHKLQA